MEPAARIDRPVLAGIDHSVSITGRIQARVSSLLAEACDVTAVALSNGTGPDLRHLNVIIAFGLHHYEQCDIIIVVMAMALQTGWSPPRWPRVSMEGCQG